MKVARIVALVLLLVPGFLSSCQKKKDSTAAAGNGKVKIEFFNVVGSSSLNMGNQWYINEHGDSFMVSKLNYYISNVKLNGPSVSFTESNSYHLIKQSDATTTSFDMSGVPLGQYTSITFMLGVDSLHNVSGAQSGALDPINGMFWDWNTGYIMLMFEGTSPRSPQMGNTLTFHIGGFSGVDSVQRVITLPLSSAITVAASGENHIHLTGDVLHLFKSPNIIDFSVLNNMMAPGATAAGFANNYANMFTITYAGL